VWSKVAAVRVGTLGFFVNNLIDEIQLKVMMEEKLLYNEAQTMIQLH